VDTPARSFTGGQWHCAGRRPLAATTVFAARWNLVGLTHGRLHRQLYIDGWAVKYLAISPILVDYSGNLFRAIVLARPALTNFTQMRQEIREFGRAALVVGALGPLGYILVLWAMTMAPISHVAPARELATLVGTYFGSRLLKEHAGWSRVAGALCIVLGVICLAAADS
jgi:drug/metabolite transporter (DMT)-like permease